MIKYFILFLFLFSQISYSQEKYNITGTIKNSNNEPLEAITIKLILKQTGNLKYYTISDKNGKFLISDILSGDYDMHIVSLNYTDLKKAIQLNENLNLKTVILEDDINQLNEVIIKTRKKAIKQIDEGIQLNVKGTVLESKHNIIDILELSPNISTVNGLEIVGNKDIGVILNGVKLNLKPSQILTFLQSIKPKTVKKIEIIDSLDASNDSNISGLIKITSIDTYGTLGSISSTSIYNNKFGSTNDVDFYFNKAKTRIYASAYKSDKNTVFKENINKIVNNEIFYDSQTKRNFKRQERNAILGVDYKIDSLNTLSFLYDFTEDNDKDYNILTNTQIHSVQIQDSIIKNDAKLNHLSKIHTISLQYNKILDSLNSNFKISSDYVLDKFDLPKKQIQSFYSNLNLINELNTEQTYGTQNNLFGTQLDWNKNYTNGNVLKIGAKYSLSSVDENYSINSNNEIHTSFFKYNESTITAYLVYKYKFAKTRLSLGLRNEYILNTFGSSNMNKRSYNFFSPTLYYPFNLKKDNRMYFYITKKIRKPSFYQYNPNIQIDNSLYHSSGNKNLKPIDIYRFQMGYTYKRKYSIILKYDYKENLIISNSIFNDETGVTYTKPVNSGYQNSTLLYLSIPLKFTNWWEVNNGISLIYANYTLPLLDNRANYKSSYGTISSNHSFTFRRKIHINLGLNYTTRNTYLFTKNEPSFTSNFNVSLPIIIKKLSLYFSVNDILSTQKSNSSNYINSIYSHIESTSNSRSFYISLTYDFSSGKEVDDTIIEPIIKDEKKRSSH